MSEQQLATYNPEFEKNKRRIEVIKSQIAKGSTDDELEYFMQVANKYDLDPLLKEIWFIKQLKKIKDSRGNWDYPRLPDGQADYSKADTVIYTSRDGYLKIAQRDENFKGILSMAVCEGDEFSIDAETYKVTHKFGSKRGKIIGAWAKVDHTKRSPVIVYVNFSEYNTGKTTWAQYPTAMIIKVAEVFALKRQFGISGLVTKEEMSHTIPDEPQEPEIIEPVSKISPEQITKLWTVAKKAGFTEDDIHKWTMHNFNKSSTRDLTVEEFVKIFDALTRAVEKKAS